ncbi:hypothetical protein NJT12_04870 [Flavobacterium sp. AC]|uniref:Uncharacterized protein n=1 Tax=Flavobacterium azizsancarii TaxID=2961580 RepID=A0ABT4WA15_9FLAO|nr:hypothetical protein [Flavobacterium azizsancarii]MDA6068949.1 hypothetical protein [Flavobacterium azizsancarii]
METPKDRILMIIERLGMSGVKAAEVMKITDNTFRKNKMESVLTHNFTEKNYNDLVDFLITEVKLLLSLKDSSLGITEAFKVAMDKVYENYEKLNMESSNFNLFENLKTVVDWMEIPDSFGSNMRIYSNIINEIEKLSKDVDDPNIFTIEKYNDYAHSDKIISHNRWFDFIANRRMNIINDILK